jgi:hypothetical protein
MIVRHVILHDVFSLRKVEMIVAIFIVAAKLKLTESQGHGIFPSPCGAGAENLFPHVHACVMHILMHMSEKIVSMTLSVLHPHNGGAVQDVVSSIDHDFFAPTFLSSFFRNERNMQLQSRILLVLVRLDISSTEAVGMCRFRH